MKNILNLKLFLFNIKFYDSESLELLARYGFNLLISFVLIVLIYNRYQKNHEYVFTYFMFNTIVFFVCFMLNGVKISMGFAFGLFALFAILRYRTETIPIKEMTYLFSTITIGVINALATGEVTYLELLFLNISVLCLAFVLEFYLSRSILLEKEIVYEKIENIKPDNHAQLMSDLRERTGLNIIKFEILLTDFLRDIARIRVFYKQDND